MKNTTNHQTARITRERRTNANHPVAKWRLSSSTSRIGYFCISVSFTSSAKNRSRLDYVNVAKFEKLTFESASSSDLSPNWDSRHCLILLDAVNLSCSYSSCSCSVQHTAMHSVTSCAWCVLSSPLRRGCDGRSERSLFASSLYSQSVGIHAPGQSCGWLQHTRSSLRLVLALTLSGRLAVVYFVSLMSCI